MKVLNWLDYKVNSENLKKQVHETQQNYARIGLAWYYLRIF